MALSELSERCYRTIGHYLSTIGVHYRTIGPGLSPGVIRSRGVTLNVSRNLSNLFCPRLQRYTSYELDELAGAPLDGD